MATSYLAIEAGTLVAGDFRVVRLLGEGGMGAVYLVEQVSTGAPRALKVMHGDLAKSMSFRRRFEQEARASAKIPSDHVVSVLAAGVDETLGLPWIAMELLEGETLDVRIDDRGPMPEAEALELFRGLCHALGEAHKLGIVHRDLKPQNVFLAHSKRPGELYTPKLVDFGIAKLTAEAQTNATGALGTPLWMAPEQTAPRATIGPEADVWALGLLFFYVTTGNRYWLSAHDEEASLAQLLREVTLEPVDRGSVRAEKIGCGGLWRSVYDAWLDRCLRREPHERFADGKRAFAALGQARQAAAEPPRVEGGDNRRAALSLESTQLADAAAANPFGEPEGGPAEAFPKEPPRVQLASQGVAGQDLAHLPTLPAGGGMAPEPARRAPDADAPVPPAQQWPFVSPATVDRELADRRGDAPVTLPSPVLAEGTTGGREVPPTAAALPKGPTHPSRWGMIALVGVGTVAAAAFVLSRSACIRTPSPTAMSAVPAPHGSAPLANRASATGPKSTAAMLDAGHSYGALHRPMIFLEGQSGMKFGFEDGDSEEKPVVHRDVNSFYIERTEVTVADYRACVAAGYCSEPVDGQDCNWNVSGRARSPMNCIEYGEAERFCHWLGRRLPTEFEWEYAAGGKEKNLYPWGMDLPTSSHVCWGRCKLDAGTCDVATHDAGNTKTGLSDMAGNVWEWTSTPFCHLNAVDECPSKQRTVRGGGYCEAQVAFMRTTNRIGRDPKDRSSSTGFRCVKPH